ncbi:MAG: DNA polymerase I, partial [Deltaproteobacteria bacterium]|nr:DNA polymerase I [Deltaproteobacteria bacterium]
MNENSKKGNGDRLFIIDGSSLIYRAFHAIPATFTNSRGMPTNAVYGFIQSLRKILKDFKPGYIAIAFDVKGPSFRHGIFTEYKAERPPMPDLLSVQIPYIKKAVKAFRIPALEMPSFEADDVIATLVKKVESDEGIRVAVITGDKDMYQLVDEKTVILDYLTEKEYGPGEVVEKFGVGATLIRDMMGLAGDSIDNIPGVPGVGIKTAAKLIKEFGTLENIYGNLDSVKGAKLKENLKNFRDQAFLSRELATLHPDVPLDCSLDDLKYEGPDYKLLEPLLNELDFKKILTEMLPEMPVGKEEGTDYRAVTDLSGLDSMMRAIKANRKVSVTLRMTEEDFSGELLGISVALDAKRAYYIPVGEGGFGTETLSISRAFKEFLEDGSYRKETDNSKSLYLYFKKRGVGVSGVGLDTSLASYLLNPSRSGHSIETLAYEFLGSHFEPAVSEEPVELRDSYCKKACYIFELAEILDKKLDEENLKPLYLDMELPLSGVLASMEFSGVRVDSEMLRSLSKEIEIDLADNEKKIYAAAGVEFNINSPKQLSEVLFEKLRLKPVKRTKTGFSTDEEVLTRLAAEHEVPALIIAFRQLSKLKSTYVDALLEIINPSTGRIHTSFNQTVTATGRLSSSRPNLQNIPVRSEAAARIREAFVADEGYTFFSADYSQIELRIVAHLSEDPVFIDAFMKGEDIHTRTASEIFGIMPSLVTPEMRRRAKAINFGIIYGMGPYGLSTELGISMKEASGYIDDYFAHYSTVKGFIDRTIAEAAERGYTVTLFGRRRFIPELGSPVESTARLGARLAINTPIQGTAADMIKAAMIRIDRLLKDGGFKSRMLLQIHDELIFEAAGGELEVLSALVKKEMEGVVKLRVPVEVNLKYGTNWRTVE